MCSCLAGGGGDIQRAAAVGVARYSAHPLYGAGGGDMQRAAAVQGVT